MLKNNLIVINPNTLVYSILNVYDKFEIKKRLHNTYFNKIIGMNTNIVKMKI